MSRIVLFIMGIMFAVSGVALFSSLFGYLAVTFGGNSFLSLLFASFPVILGVAMIIFSFMGTGSVE